MAPKGVVADSTDPATMRPDLPATVSTGLCFIPMNLPPFERKINLPPNVKPSDAWSLFELFLPQNMMQLIVEHTNSHVDHLDLYELDEDSHKKRLHQWTPMSIEEGYISDYIKKIASLVTGIEKTSPRHIQLQSLWG